MRWDSGGCWRCSSRLIDGSGARKSTGAGKNPACIGMRVDNDRHQARTNAPVSELDYADSLSICGCLATILSKVRAAPVGERRPCSHCCKVRVDMPSKPAYCACERPEAKRAFTISDSANPPSLVGTCARPIRPLERWFAAASSSAFKSRAASRVRLCFSVDLGMINQMFSPRPVFGHAVHVACTARTCDAGGKAHSSARPRFRAPQTGHPCQAGDCQHEYLRRGYPSAAPARHR